MKLENFDFSKKVKLHPKQISSIKDGNRPFPLTIELDLTNHARDNTARGLEYDGKTVYTIDQALELLGNLKLISQDQHQLQPLITLRVKLNQASIASNF